MALKLKKEIKKSSYYVWFLGAKESKGLRGSEFILPVIGNLEEREKDIEPFKVTLQVSNKGLKIIQNIVSQGAKSAKPKNEIIKHFIPHNTITCVHQKDDIIACILLLFNPVTKCPLHVHAYRCDSLETATLLKAQLQMLIERPENQKKFGEIENRLVRPAKELKKFESSIGSDTGTSTRESESSEERFSNDNTRVATLYDSVAAELRAKLNKNDVPILLPPRDYDTVHRQKGNLTGIELRRCLNSNIVGQNVKARRIESSGGSSGIGSDHAPSPESPDVNERYHGIDGHSTSDDEWNGDTETTLYLMNTTPPTMTLNRSNRPENQIQEKYDYRKEQRNPRQFDHKASKQHLEEHIRKKLALRADLEKKYLKPDDIEQYLQRERFSDNKIAHRTIDRQTSLERNGKKLSLERSSDHSNQKRQVERQTVAEKTDRFFDTKPAQRSRMEHYQDEDTFNSFERKHTNDEPRRNNNKYIEKESYVDEDYEPTKYHTQYEREFYEKEVPVPKIRQKFGAEVSNRFYDKDETQMRNRFKEQSNSRYKEEENQRYKDLETQRFKDLETQRFKDLETQRFKDLETQRFKDLEQQRLKDLETQRFKDLEQQRLKDLETQRYKELETQRFKDLEHQRYKELEQQRFKERESEHLRYKEDNQRFKEMETTSRFNKDKFYPVEEDIEERFVVQAPRYGRQKSENRQSNRSHDEYFEDTLKKRSASARQRSPSPPEFRRDEDAKISPRDRFKDAKEKFMCLERERLEQQELKARRDATTPVAAKDRKSYYDEDDFKRPARHLEAPISPVHKEKPFIKRHESMMYPKSKEFERYNNYENEKGRYFGDRFEQSPKPAPRTIPNEEVRYRRDQSSDRYTSSKFDPKRRSMFNLTEAEHKKASNDIAKELKRRSYMEQGDFYDRPDFYEPHKSSERETGYNNNFSKSTVDLDQIKQDAKFAKTQKTKQQQQPVGYRNSYAEPKYRPDKNGNKKFDLLHRTNSSVSNNGRVGIASIHPY